LPVSLLIFWSPSIPAQPTIESVPLNAAEGNDVLLLLQNPPENIFIYIWYKGKSAGNNNRIVSYTPQAQVNDSGPAYTGRETIYHNGSLLIQNITRSNAGAYTLQMSTISGLVEARLLCFCTDMVTKPSIQASFTTVTENKGSVTLTCHSNHTEISFRWLFEGQSLQLTERTMLSRNHGALTIDPIKRWDAGEYQCEVYNPVSSSKSDPLVLAVKSALPTPFIISNSSNPVEDQDSVTLTCYPETQNTTYLWLINNQSLPETDRLELSSDNRTLTVYSVTRNDTGSYECRTRNEVNSRRSDPFILNVLYGPDTPTISPSYWYYPPGANLILSCNATSNPPAQYSWLINGTYLQSTQVLFIPNITASHSGNYTCHVHNNATGFNRTTVKSITVSG
uniref:Ig-like domain-containing protein n=1 Tax=Loxodonta africana TaxID=9785 RepID=G3SWG4_LOXAF